MDKVANLAYLAVAFLMFAVINWSAPAITYQPQGIVLPAKEKLSQGHLSAVKVYERVASGIYYQTLATIHVQSRYLKPSRQGMLDAVRFGQQLAATVGASGLLLEQIGESPTTKTYIINAKAIK